MYFLYRYIWYNKIGSGCRGTLRGALTPCRAQRKPQLPSLAQEGFLFLWAVLSCPVCLALGAVLSCVLSPRGLLIPPSYPMDFFWEGSRTPAVVAGPRDEATATRTPCRAPCSTLAKICLFSSGGPYPISCPCVSWGASRVPPRWYCYGAGRAFREGGVMSVLCRLCHVFPPLVSIYVFSPVRVKCDYELILVQLCLSIIYDYPVY